MDCWPSCRCRLLQAAQREEIKTKNPFILKEAQCESLLSPLFFQFFVVALQQIKNATSAAGRRGTRLTFLALPQSLSCSAFRGEQGTRLNYKLQIGRKRTRTGATRRKPTTLGHPGDQISWGVRLTDGVAFAVPVQHVQRGDEELVGVLLLVACQVTCVSPHQVQQPEGNVGRPVARVELGGWKGEER